MIELSIAEIAGIVGGRLVNADPDRTVSGKVEFDSRKVVAGDLFLAIPGARVDGHDYAEAAVAAGAVAVLASRPVPVPAIEVADPVEAITTLARAVARRLSAVTIGITGSSGKTSTKDLLAQVLADAGPTVATPGSFNNELGYPYTVLLADESTRFLVLETSARGLGHIRHLTGIAAPRLAGVLNVGSAHLSEFGSREVIAQAKGELVEALPAAADGGVAVLNADDPLVSAMAARTTARVVTAGERAGADVRAEGVAVDSAGRASFELVSAAGRAGVRLQVRGEHQVSNAVIAAALALACGMELPAVAEALSRATERSAWRMAVSETAAGITVINDAYNANPESMRAALKALAIMSEGRRSIAVLGHMAELGPDSIAQHDALGRHAVRLDVSVLIAVGEQARAIATGAALEGSFDGESEWMPDTAAALARLAELLRPGDVVLVKGSRSAAMEVVAQELVRRFDSTQDVHGAESPNGAQSTDAREGRA
ncbi:UDP-N-acetylmuramoyl-tripeptide--D-alanyl-D-alanine ligase [Jatrophihabitans sp.]|uniref:UDP-N-acetylmuramoyl-tripeptide--D-alanyl-D- alanine ligase n=1 Tax=Jatrophihabitans sp. TaxID=1932789 RepID=UPI002C8CF325|nr:UDP-N-acetylmuramoyl-tripeptide--D-alanyl-D-alanine ligase [Jatrophihabitans sp.]